jgi:hypothetical protein
MPNYIPINIEVSPAVKKYLEYHLDKRNRIISKRDIFGLMLINMLKQSPYGFKKKDIPENQRFFFKVLDHFDYRKSRSFYIHDDDASSFNSYVKKIMDLELYSQIAISVASDKEKINNAIIDFREKYSIDEEDLTLDAMKKAFYRARKSLNIQSVSELRDLVAVCPFFDQLFEHTLTRS